MNRPFVRGEMDDVSTHLNEEFAAVEELVADAQTEARTVNLQLHGSGRIQGSGGGVLSAGSGLSARLTNTPYMVGGQWVDMVNQAGFVVIPVTANQDNYIYMDGDGAFQVFSPGDRPGSSPEGTWYVGMATAGALAVTAVDQTDVEEVASLTEVLSVLTALKQTIGWPYTGELDIQTRLLTLEAGTGEGGTVTVYWGAITKAVGNSQSITEAIAAAIIAALQQHATDYHAGQTQTVAPDDWWDVEGDNNSQMLMLAAQWLPQLPWTQRNRITIVHGIFGDGSNGSPDYRDTENSTIWV